MNIFESINAIDWTSVHHAYGVASDIPSLLRALLSPQQVERQNAIKTLDNLIHHQGTLYEAAVYVASVLVEMLQVPETPDKENIVGTLALLTYDKPSEDCSPEELKLAQSLRALIEQHLELLYPYLKAKEPTVRWIIAYTLALFPEQGGITLPLLKSAFAEEQQADVKKGIGEAVTRLQSLAEG
jgi:hypothetical protein